MGHVVSMVQLLAFMGYVVSRVQLLAFMGHVVMVLAFTGSVLMGFTADSAHCAGLTGLVLMVLMVRELMAFMLIVLEVLHRPIADQLHLWTSSPHWSDLLPLCTHRCKALHKE
uniref:Uncharacterized protein n=1 Tax=Dunaliella tertiolecta TaxID=3047 RepID=A0A7S3QNM1_DUNTE